MIRKHLFTVGVTCCTCIFFAHAQLAPPYQKLPVEKASLFSKLPEQFDVSSLWVQKLFAGPDSGAVKIPLTENNFFEGLITAKKRMNANVINLNVRSSNFNGALLSLSQITYDDLRVTYIGRIVSIQYGDVFELTQEGTKLRFKKKKQSTVITE